MYEKYLNCTNIQPYQDKIAVVNFTSYNTTEKY